MNSYLDMIEDSRQALKDVDCLSLKKNPVVLRYGLGSQPKAALVEVLRQYSALPSCIVEYLTIGMQRLAGWPSVSAELQRNRCEELGSRTAGRTHYEILKERVRQELGVSLDDVPLSPATVQFVQGVRRALWNNSLEFIAGMLYALEASAVSELAVVAQVMNEVARLDGKDEVVPLARMLGDWQIDPARHPLSSDCRTLADFFALHMWDFEIGHELGLADTFKSHIENAGKRADFEAGFKFVLGHMEIWWACLAGAHAESSALEPGRPKRTREADLAGVPL